MLQRIYHNFKPSKTRMNLTMGINTVEQNENNYRAAMKQHEEEFS